MIEIDVQNYEELAKKNSFVARVASRVVRDTLKWRVERIIAEEIKKNLAERGVKVTVYVR